MLISGHIKESQTPQTCGLQELLAHQLPSSISYKWKCLKVTAQRKMAMNAMYAKYEASHQSMQEAKGGQHFHLSLYIYYLSSVYAIQKLIWSPKSSLTWRRIKGMMSQKINFAGDTTGTSVLWRTLFSIFLPQRPKCTRAHQHYTLWGKLFSSALLFSCTDDLLFKEEK